MPQEPTTKRTVAFIDGPNLYHTARQAFGYYDVQKPARALCQRRGWTRAGVRFYPPRQRRETHENQSS